MTDDEHADKVADSLDSIAVQIGRVANLLALEALSGMDDRPQMDRIELLLNAGFTASETAELVGTSPGTVRSARARLRNDRGTSGPAGSAT